MAELVALHAIDNSSVDVSLARQFALQFCEFSSRDFSVLRRSSSMEIWPTNEQLIGETQGKVSFGAPGAFLFVSSSRPPMEILFRFANEPAELTS